MALTFNQEYLMSEIRRLAEPNPEEYESDVQALSKITSEQSTKQQTLRQNSSSSTAVSSLSSNNTSESNKTTVKLNRSKRLKGLVNHEYCDYCDEGGDLLNCDRCPNSFHLLCHEPPFDEDNAPKSEFLCNQCKYKRMKSEQAKASSSDTNLKVSKIKPVHLSSSSNEIKTRSSTLASSSTSSLTQLAEDSQQTIDFEIIDNEPALKTLIRMAKLLNPRQMQLPKNVQTSFEIPGVSKIQWWTKEGNRIAEQKENIKKKEKTENCINIPKKTCFYCRKTSRIGGQLIQCDFCPLHYHLDCLNPPLCSQPKDRWMCPNHIEHILDTKLVSSLRLSERIKLWNKYSTVDPHVVKLDFIKRINTFKQSDDTQQSENKRKIVYAKVPDSIKQYYLNAVNVEDVYNSIIEKANVESLPIESNSAVEQEKVGQLGELRFNKNDSNTLTATESEQELFLSAVSCLQGLMDSKNEKSNKTQLNSDTDATQNDVIEQLKANIISYSQCPLYKECKEAIKPRAFLYYLASKTNNKGQPQYYAPIHMVYRTLMIGTNESDDVCLTKFDQKCEFISPKHAVIYYDQQTHHYELLNYSVNGTVVDNVLYSIDLSDDDDNEDKDNGADALAIPNDNDDDSHEPKMSSKSSKTSVYWSCKCPRSLSDAYHGKCWEGSAILNHGSHVKFGCLEFVFSIVDYELLNKQ